MPQTKVTGKEIANVPVNLQADTTNTLGVNMKIQTGWGRITMPANPYTVEAVTFPEPFSSIPIVVISHGGDRSAAQGAGNYGDGANIVHGLVTSAAMSPTVSGFTAKLGSASAAYSAGDTVYYQWIAIGTP